MRETLTTSQAADILLADENANWSYAGALALVEYFEAIEEECDMVIEMDRVAIRCDYSEYGDLVEWAEEYGLEEEIADWTKEELDGDEIDEKIRDYIYERGQLIEFDGGIIVSSF